MKSKNDRQGSIVETKHISIFNLIKRCDSIISMYISTGWLKSNIHTWIYPWIYPWISISTASLDKNGYNSACVKDICEIFASIWGFSGMCHRMLPIAFSPDRPRCHGNEILDKIGYNSVCVRAICEIFAPIGGGSKMRHWMLQIAFFPDRPLLPWQRNLEQNWL